MLTVEATQSIRKMTAAKQQFDKLKSASAQTWEDAKAKIAACIDDSGKNYDRAAEPIKKSD